jgi:hypothetical protein
MSPQVPQVQATAYVPPPPPNPPMFGAQSAGGARQRQQAGAGGGFSGTILGGAVGPQNTAQRTLLGVG